MGSYISSTDSQQQQMLRESGYRSFDDMFSDIPDDVSFQKKLSIPDGMSEMEAAACIESVADQNTVFHHIFRGAGAYDHYIPAIVRQVTAKEEFLTAYTPYQPEISQGILQSVFEYQTMICELTGMDVSNASVYDGATAAAEGIAMTVCQGREKILVSAAVNPRVLSVIKTYCHGRNITVQLIPCIDGRTDTAQLLAAADNSVAGIYIEQPNFFGVIEDAQAIGAGIHHAGGLLVMGCNPVALALIESPARAGADIVTGEGQPLGLPLSFGGPYLGFMAARQQFMRRMPGRIVGQTVDQDGNRGFVLTLQTREQHIRREKAGSNICSNEALCALTAAVYLSALGPSGFRSVAVQCTSKAHYLQQRLAEIDFALVYQQPFFHEFVTECPGNSSVLMQRLAQEKILGGLPLSDHTVLWCVTEKNTRASIDMLIACIRRFSV
jgi:glycine dehydrogenase subunit 1